MPSVWAAVTSSDASHTVRSGALVARYADNNTTIVTAAATTLAGSRTARRARGVRVFIWRAMDISSRIVGRRLKGFRIDLHTTKRVGPEALSPDPLEPYPNALLRSC